MQAKWYRLTEHSNGEQPDFAGYEDYIESWAGNKAHPDGSPKWVAVVYAASAVHDDLEGESSIQSLSNIPVDALNAITGNDKTEAEWDEVFHFDSSNR